MKPKRGDAVLFFRRTIQGRYSPILMTVDRVVGEVDVHPLSQRPVFAIFVSAPEAFIPVVWSDSWKKWVSSSRFVEEMSEAA